MIKPVQSTVSCVRQIERLSSQSVVECRFPQSSGITEVVLIQPQLSCVSCEVADGRVNYSGKIIFTVVYSDEEGKLCRMQKGAEFSHYCDSASLAPAQSGVCLLKCEKLTVKRDGSAYVASAVISADIEIYARAERIFISSADGAYLNMQSISFPTRTYFSADSEAEDDFEADGVEDVLAPQAKALVHKAECSVGEIEVSGEIYLSLLAMRGQNPVCLERIIPFKRTIMCDDADSKCVACARAEVSELNVTCSVNEERGKCDVSFTCNIDISGYFVSFSESEAAVDAFSESENVELSRAEEEFSACDSIKIYTEKVSALAATKSRLGYDCKFYAAAKPTAECAYNAQTGCAEGAARCCLIYGQNGEIKSCEVETPFSVPLNGVAQGGEEVELDATICGMAVRLRAEGEAEAEFTLKICAVVTSRKKISYLTEIAANGEIDESDCAVSVYFSAAGDGLWDVAKKLNKSPDFVAACNPALTYPLTGRERIVIYRKK